MVVTTSKLRENIYQLLDQVLRTGVPLEIDRKGKKLEVVLKKKSGHPSHLIKRDIIVGEPDELVHIDWSSEITLDPL
ncbi:MAG: type II toxin-antitoxin system Phd/YefM family antitoxin [Deltaproteobacteria bacterium]|nr:type II toxin-antitoxin system Phd/YefM family antitoxin [Deltaproteobacteria bacterium]